MVFRVPGALPVSRRGLQPESAREGQLEAAERREVWLMDGGGRDNGSAPHAFGVRAAGSGCSPGWSRERFTRGTSCCADPPAKEGDAGEVEQGGWMRLRSGTGLSSKVKKPVSIAAMPITPPFPRTPDQQQRPRTTAAQHPP